MSDQRNRVQAHHRRMAREVSVVLGDGWTARDRPLRITRGTEGFELRLPTCWWRRKAVPTLQIIPFTTRSDASEEEDDSGIELPLCSGPRRIATAIRELKRGR